MKEYVDKQEALRIFKFNSNGERIPDNDCDNFPIQVSIKQVKDMLRALPAAEVEIFLVMIGMGDDWVLGMYSSKDMAKEAIEEHRKTLRMPHSMYRFFKCKLNRTINDMDEIEEQYDE